MQQLVSSTRSEDTTRGSRAHMESTPASAMTAEDWAAIDQRCHQLELLVGELLLKNETLRMQLAAQKEEA